MHGTIHIKSERPGWKGGRGKDHGMVMRIRKGSLATNLGTAQECLEERKGTHWEKLILTHGQGTDGFWS